MPGARVGPKLLSATSKDKTLTALPRHTSPWGHVARLEPRDDAPTVELDGGGSRVGGLEWSGRTVCNSSKEKGTAVALRAGEADIAILPTHYRVLAKFRVALRTFLAFSQSAARREGLTPQQHQALLAIKGSGWPMTVGDLAAQLLIRHHSAVELSGRLARAGLLDRATDPADGRKVLLSLAPEAEDRLRRLSAIHLQELRAMRPALADLLAAIDTIERQ